MAITKIYYKYEYKCPANKKESVNITHIFLGGDKGQI